MWDFTRISVTQDSLQELKEIWDQWNNEVRQLFYSNYRDLPYLLDVKVDKHLFWALIHLVVFPKALGHVDEAVIDLFDRLDKGITPVPAILPETFRFSVWNLRSCWLCPIASTQAV
ncbi:hypothetical protein Goshw_015109 [Gossypium schwendimanii]|uniref:Uncharacterized protein n=1 Tax=Gossypium schwendimanii TaxID=34291 RepID=A0A7J9N8Y3_GOSSC|nr:hypothetical protein [Gossypium schwendimanii]